MSNIISDGDASSYSESPHKCASQEESKKITFGVLKSLLSPTEGVLEF